METTLVAFRPNRQANVRDLFEILMILLTKFDLATLAGGRVRHATAEKTAKPLKTPVFWLR